MRKTFRFPVTGKSLLPSSSFSSSAGGGRGRGRGRAISPTPTQFDFSPPSPGKPISDQDSGDSITPSGLGHGRGKPIDPPTPTPTLPSFSSLNPPLGRGQTKKPIFFSKEDFPKPQLTNLDKDPQEDDNLPASILSVLTGAGRGKPTKESAPIKKMAEENRHLRAREGGAGRGVDRGPSPLRMSREEAVRNARGFLSRGDGGEEGGGGRGRGRAMGFRGRGGRSRGGRGGRGGGGWGGRGREERRFEDDDDDEDDDDIGLNLSDDDVNVEEIAKSFGPGIMDQITEGFEEMSSRVLPSPVEEAYYDALHTNCLIEFEPEYLMADFASNPDIDEKPPIPLRDAFEKMKPFLMQYEGIKSQEEWEEVMKETMEQVPRLKQLVDAYSGPDRVTAKRQNEELERVAKTLPESAPSSVKRFTDRAVLSLQSNPSWGFDKKCQFMDKLVWEVSQQYK